MLYRNAASAGVLALSLASCATIGGAEDVGQLSSDNVSTAASHVELQSQRIALRTDDAAHSVALRSLSGAVVAKPKAGQTLVNTVETKRVSGNKMYTIKTVTEAPYPSVKDTGNVDFVEVAAYCYDLRRKQADTACKAAVRYTMLDLDGLSVLPEYVTLAASKPDTGWAMFRSHPREAAATEITGSLDQQLKHAEIIEGMAATALHRG
ncbi:MAG TPA: hypothetical protein VF572_07095 [Candidatus Saccharimonadales bacterium]|jgi:hypothetical protein